MCRKERTYTGSSVIIETSFTAVRVNGNTKLGFSTSGYNSYTLTTIYVVHRLLILT